MSEADQATSAPAPLAQHQVLDEQSPGALGEEPDLSRSKPARKKARLSSESTGKGKQKASAEDGSGSEDEDEGAGAGAGVEEDTTTQKGTQKRKRNGRPPGGTAGEKKKISMLQARASAGDGEITFSIASFVNVELPSQVIKPMTARGTERQVQPAPIQLGPFQINNRTTWPTLLDDLTKTVKAERENLVILSIRWSWSATSPKGKALNARTLHYLPLTDEAACAVIVKSIREAVTAGSICGNEFILISMAQPLSLQQHTNLVCLPLDHAMTNVLTVVAAVAPTGPSHAVHHTVAHGKLPSISAISDTGPDYLVERKNTGVKGVWSDIAFRSHNTYTSLYSPLSTRTSKRSLPHWKRRTVLVHVQFIWVSGASMTAPRISTSSLIPPGSQFGQMRSCRYG